MKFTHYKWDKPVFHQAAIYKCDCCNYSCEMYANFEHVEPHVSDCAECDREDAPTHYLPVFLYRWDCYPKLSVDPAFVSDQNMHCPDCRHAAGLPAQVHWTELRVTCWQCESGRMSFTEFVDGEKMEEFVSIAIEESKLKAPDIDYTCVIDGREYYVSADHLGGSAMLGQKNIISVDSWEYNFSAT